MNHSVWPLHILHLSLPIFLQFFSYILESCFVTSVEKIHNSHYPCLASLRSSFIRILDIHIKMTLQTAINTRGKSKLPRFFHHEVEQIVLDRVETQNAVLIKSIHEHLSGRQYSFIRYLQRFLWPRLLPFLSGHITHDLLLVCVNLCQRSCWLVSCTLINEDRYKRKHAITCAVIISFQQTFGPVSHEQSLPDLTVLPSIKRFYFLAALHHFQSFSAIYYTLEGPILEFSKITSSPSLLIPLQSCLKMNILPWLFQQH